MKNTRIRNLSMTRIISIEWDAVVNPTNASLNGGSKINKAIHKAAGEELDFECKKIGHCEVGEAIITKGYNLPAKYIIHTVAPHFKKHLSYQEIKYLRDCYYNSLALADKNNLKCIALPIFGTEHIGYSILNTTFSFLSHLLHSPFSFLGNLLYSPFSSLGDLLYSECTLIAIYAVSEYLKESDSDIDITFVCRNKLSIPTFNKAEDKFFEKYSNMSFDEFRKALSRSNVL